MSKLLQKMAVAAAALLLSEPASAGAVISGFDSNTLERCDDCSSPLTSLGFTANFYNNEYSNLYINNNGNVTFNSPLLQYNDIDLNSGPVIIAPLFSDVDTRPLNGGSVTYGTGTYEGRSAFGVTWKDVGPYLNGTSYTGPTNTFQLLLVQRDDYGYNGFDIIMNYDRVLWDISTASTAAVAGFNGGNGQTFAIFGSYTSGSFLDSNLPQYRPPGGLIYRSITPYGADGVLGRYIFQVDTRGGHPYVNPVPEPTTWAMMVAGFGIVGGAMRRRRTKTVFA